MHNLVPYLRGKWGTKFAYSPWSRYGKVKEMLKDKCVVSNIEGVTAGGESACFWSMTTSAETGLPVKWAGELTSYLS